MNQRFKTCLERRQIYKSAASKRLVSKELMAAQQDLAEAQDSFAAKKHKWTTIQAYYAMFHACRALLYSRGYRERSHHCLSVAIEALFVDTKKIKVGLLRSFTDVKALREKADYDLDFSSLGAEKSLQAADEFIEKAKQILELKHR